MQVSKHPLYHIWNGMVRRCRDTKNINYPFYGARGINVCEEWSIRGEWGTRQVPSGFLSFLSYVEENLGERPVGHSLDRIDNSGDYEPGNIRWANQSTQNFNRRVRNEDMKYLKRVKSGRVQLNMWHNGTRQYIGTYDTIEEASSVRDQLVAERD